MAQLTKELTQHKKFIEREAQKCGLDFFETIFEFVSYEEMRKLAAYGGFPHRYPYWKFGMEFHRFKKSDEYGLSKIYELVINHDPCYAYLLENNELIDQKLVIAHVFGHSDFFKNNKWFSKTNRKMMEQMKIHEQQVLRHIEEHGYEKVEKVIDHFLSLENLIDRYAPYRAQQHSLGKPEKPSQENPNKDILLFLIHFGDLEKWEQDILCLIRDEAYYFAPQYMTKIMNEGWASYWHSKLMTEKIMDDADIIGFADRHSSATVMQGPSLNPYKIGIELFRHIKERWDKGQFGKEWESCKDLEKKLSWDLHEGRGEEKIFEVRENYNDATFIKEFLTQEFCQQSRIDFQGNQKGPPEEVFKKWKSQILLQLFNSGHPLVQIVDSNYKKGGLLLEHVYEGLELDIKSVRACLESLFFVWKKSVTLKTVQNKEEKMLSFDGKKHR